MKIHFISTINGSENEGMRNIATHLARSFEDENNVVYSSLQNILSIVFNSLRSDLTVICVRLNAKTYQIVKLAAILCRKVYVIAVQRPQADYIAKVSARPIRCAYFVIAESDAAELQGLKDATVRILSVGIDAKKFSPVSKAASEELKRKYGIPLCKPLVVHVGHCSEGRGLEDFSAVGPEYSKLVVASGMFEEPHVMSELKSAGVRLHTEYLPEINEIYQMADCYLFPTRSTEHVISIPLSVMEALSCGVPVVAYDSFSGVRTVKARAGSVIYVSEVAEIPAAIDKAVRGKSERTFLINPKSWREAAEGLISCYEEGI